MCLILKLTTTLTLLMLLILMYFLVHHPSEAAAATYNVLSFGAKPDGRTDSTKAFLSAWAKACGSAQPASVVVPQGRFLLGSATFKGKCNNRAITLDMEGTLVAPSDYRVIGNNKNWLLFDDVYGVTLRGGVLDAQGASLWNCKNNGNGNCPDGATTLGFSNSNKIVVAGLTSKNSQMFHITFNGCHNVKAQGVTVIAAGNSPNTDGIHVQHSSNVTILKSKIYTGDDCISVGPGTTNLWIENITCGPGHGISIGSLGWNLSEPGVKNVTVKRVTFTGTQNGFRIKTWGKPSNGFARDVVFQDAIMVNVYNPIVIDQNYCPGDRGCPGQASGIRISNVTYQNINGTSATEVAVNFDCSSKYPCTGIKLENVKLSYKNRVAQASCNHADGSSLGTVQPQSCL